MEKFTYLFGAGASCNCLPIYSNFNQRFIAFTEFIEKDTNPITGEEIAAKTNLLKELKFYLTELRFHSTPDTYAKKVFHTKPKEELNKFKCILILFFIYEQIQNFPALSKAGIDSKAIEEKQPFDKRYDSFIAALLKPIPEKIEFLSDIKILTWNYDLQFEIAFMQYFQSGGLYETQQQIQSLPKLRQSGFTPLKANDKLSIIHLNGIAYPFTYLQFPFEERIGKFYEDRLIVGSHLFEVYKIMKSDGLSFTTTTFSFAWESLDESFAITNSNLQRALEETKLTETLIINGYSFPIFNRAVDVKLIENMKKLKHIYIQDKYGAKNIKQILETFTNYDLKNEIHDLGYYNQFHIPAIFKKETIPFPAGMVFF